MSMSTYYIFGDNIVECDRFFNLIKISLPNSKVISAGGTYFQPTRVLDFNNEKIEFVFIPGFGRRVDDISEQLNTEILILRETADIFFAKENETGELTIILALEFCSALHAGNQAWQRQGRGYSIGLSGVPYLYVSEIGGLELDENRIAKAARLPNPTVPYSFVEFSRTNQSISVPIYRKSPEYIVSNLKLPEDVFGEDVLYKVINEIVTSGKITNESIALMLAKMTSFINHILSKNIQNKSPIAQISLSHFLKSTWKKKISIPITENMLNFIELLPKVSLGINDLPICILDKKSKNEDIIKIFEKCFPGTGKFINEALNTNETVGIVLIAGFKPRGDDSRPDRGLMPLARMLLGSNAQIISVLYGPMKPTMLRALSTSPKQLATQNGLIQSVYNLSDYIIANPNVNGLPFQGIKGIYKERISSITKNVKKLLKIKKSFALPIAPGEHDVDTAIHTIFTRPNNSSIQIFEGLCNPPGGDWAGISLLNSKGTECRWISLPRVTNESKRPDHVIQLTIEKQQIILIIESKEKKSSVESKIGHRLKLYLEELLKHKPSIVRIGQSWERATENFDISKIIYVTAAAYLVSENTKGTPSRDWGVDFAMEFIFNGKNLELELIPITKNGKTWCEVINKII